MRLADALAAGDFAQAGAVLGAAGEETVNPLLGGLLAGWIEVGREDFPAASARFDAMTGNDALAAYGQYHKALALAFAGDFVGAAAILEGDEEGPLHLNRAAIVAHAQVLAQIGREDDAVALLDEALAGGVPDAPLIALRDRLAAGEEVPFDQVTRPRDGAAEAFLTLADALNGEDSAARRAGPRPARRAYPPRSRRGASCSPPTCSRRRSSTSSPARRCRRSRRPRPGTSRRRCGSPTPSAPPATPMPASPR